jgi:hypothetical protein
MNIEHVRREIQKKLNYNKPYYADYNSMNGVMGDFDQFPYKRFFRGQFDSAQPIIIERECSWRPMNNDCYKEIVIPTPNPPNYCWEYPCSTIGSCRAKQEPADLKADGVIGSNNCGSKNCKQSNYIISP